MTSKERPTADDLLDTQETEKSLEKEECKPHLCPNLHLYFS